jgi:hypothetical protein
MTPERHCVNSGCRYYDRERNSAAVPASPETIRLLTDEVRRYAEGQTIYMCGNCRALWVDPWDYLGKFAIDTGSFVPVKLDTSRW